MDVQLETFGGSRAEDIRETLADLYEAAYADRLDDRFRNRIGVLSRLDGHLTRPVTFVSAKAEGKLIGFGYGFPLPPGSPWWRSFQPVPGTAFDPTDREFFAIAELMVKPERRRQGIARQLHNRLLAQTDLPCATMLVDPANTPARSAYIAWGWQLVGHMQPFPESPRFESRVRDLASLD